MIDQHHYYSLANDLLGQLAHGQKYTKEQLITVLGDHNSIYIDTLLQILSTSKILLAINEGYYQLIPHHQRCDQQKITVYYGKRGLIHLLPIIDSTNTYLLQKVNQLTPGEACIAEYQWKGRGRHNSRWLAPFGTNALFSIYWSLPLNLEIIEGISLAMGVVLAENLQRLGVPNILLKWPNDLYIDGRKLAGILTETIFTCTKLVHVVVGAGINLMAKKATDQISSQQTISLQDLGISLDINQIIGTTLTSWHKAFKCIEREGLTPFLVRWSKLDALTAKTIKLVNGSQEITGLYKGINKQGALLLERNGRTHTFTNGQVTKTRSV